MTYERDPLQDSDAQKALRDVLRSLREVKAQRLVTRPETAGGAARKAGEIWGLDVGIAAIERRLK